MTPDQWFALVLMLQQQSAWCIAKEDRKFLAEMVNALTLDEAATPLEWQRRWILTLKKECKI